MNLKATARARLVTAFGVMTLLVVAGACAAPAGGKDPLAGTYFGGGSGAGLEQIRALAKGFSALHPGVEFKLDDAGSETGIALVSNHQIDFGYISRDLTPEESRKFTSVPLMGAGTAIAVNPANPVVGLTKDQVRDIFSGKITDWAAVGGQPGHAIQVIIREPESSTRATFEAYVFGGSNPQYPASAIHVVESKEAYAQIRTLKDSIAMVTLQTSTQNDTTIRLLSLGGVAATIANIATGTYPIRRPVQLFTAADAPVKPAVKAFIEFIRSPEGARILSAF